MSRPVKSADVHPHSGLNKAFALVVTTAVGSVWAFYLFATVELGWIGLSLAHVIRFDPFPWLLLLTLGNIVQLLLMPLIMVGQKVQQAHADAMSEQNHAMLSELLRRLPPRVR